MSSTPGRTGRNPLEATTSMDGLAELCRLDSPGPFGLLIFGASGDLTQRKLIPALYRLLSSGLLPDNFFILGASNEIMDDEAFRDMALAAVKAESPNRFEPVIWNRFARNLFYEYADSFDPKSYAMLKRRFLELEAASHTAARRLFYLAVPPSIFEPIIEGLGNGGMASEEKGSSHILIEKPFGHDLDSARNLEATLSRYFKESQIYRLDHYLAKETVQNILMFRFANTIFDPLWNHRYIDHIQITVAEKLGIEDRAGYYDSAGVIRDMFQNHIFQLLALTAMEPPSAFEADLIRDEKVKVFRAIQPFGPENLGQSVILGQYAGGMVDGCKVPHYREEDSVSAGSTTPTYAAMKVFVDNWRWRGVPFYLRSGKRMTTRTAEISIHFREVPHMMFLRSVEGEIPNNVLTLQVQPHEGISLSFQTKTQGTKLCLSPVLMDFSYEKSFSLSGYERVMLDCLQDDQMLFVRNDGVMKNWEIFTPLLQSIEADGGSKHLNHYEPGTDGPAQADELMIRDGRTWRRLQA